MLTYFVLASLKILVSSLQMTGFLVFTQALVTVSALTSTEEHLESSIVFKVPQMLPTGLLDLSSHDFILDQEPLPYQMSSYH